MPDKANLSGLGEGDVAPCHIYVDAAGENPQAEPHDRGAILVAEGDYVTARAAAVLKGAKPTEAKGLTVEKVPPPPPAATHGTSAKGGR